MNAAYPGLMDAAQVVDIDCPLERHRRRPSDRKADSGGFAGAVLDSLRARICVVDVTGTIRATNRAWIDASCGADESTIGEGANYLRVCDGATGPDSCGAAEFAAGLRSVLAGTERFEMEYPCEEPTGMHWFLVSVTTLRSDGPPLAVIIHQDITELKETQGALLAANARLGELAITDGLTGLHNRRSFDTRMQSFARNDRRSQPLSLVLLDIDHFKAYNDTHGHPAGDEILRTMGELLTRHLRKQDLAARYGGEEFALLFPGADRDEAATTAERIRATIADFPWPLRPITASLGVAGGEGGDAAITRLLNEADEALYRAKSGGRNRVVSRSDD